MHRAEVVKQVDAVDSKSTGLMVRAGSIPAFGTTKIWEKTDQLDLLAGCIFLWNSGETTFLWGIYLP